MVATFNPDNVLLQDAKTGAIPQEQGSLILNEVISNSVMMQLAKYEEMTKQKKTFNYLAEGVGAYWVGEGEIIQTSKPQWLTASMEAKKLGVIVPVSREFLTYTMTDFFTAVRPLIAEAFYKKFDEATILNVDNPFNQSIQQSIETTNNIVEGDLSGDNIIDLIGKVEDNDHEPNAFISKRQNRSLLRGAVEEFGNETTRLYDRSKNELDGLPVVDLKSSHIEKGELFTGDFDQIRYGIPFNINYKISEDAQLSTVVASDGQPVNLYEQELIALRATMDIGFMVIKDDAFAKIEPSENDSGGGGVEG